MLQLILGRSGFGKTHHVLEELETLARQVDTDDMLYLLVPEQASFETERAILRTLGDADASKVHVVSFTRLCEILMNDRRTRSLSNAAGIMLMSRAIDEASDSLELLSSSSRIDTITDLLDTAKECERFAVSTANLQEAVEQLPDGTLKTKTKELALLLNTYDALCAACGSETEDPLLQLCDYLNDTRALQGTMFYVDGFKSFTAPELAVLKALMMQAAHVKIALCADRDVVSPDTFDRLDVVLQTAQRLKRIAAEAGCAVETPVFLMTPHRFRSESLRVLEERAFCPKDPDDEPPADNGAVTLTACADIYAEARFVAQRIRRLMRQDGVRAREIAVVARNLSDYIGVLDAAFDQAGIPYYLDRRAPIVSEGLVTAVMTAARIASGKWRSELLLQLMKTGLLGFSISSASSLENYVYIWNLSGAQFKTEWQSHPRGFSGTMDERDVSRLEHLNRLRRRLVTPLLTLATALAKPMNGEQFAKAIYRYIREARLDRMTARQIKRLYRNHEPALAEHTAQVWNALMSLLDDMATVLPDRLTADKAIELLHAATIATDIGAIPQAIDAVQIGAAERMRFTAPKAVFVLSANEGVFPALPHAQGLLTDRERRALIDAGVPFEDDREQHNALEQFAAYAALSAASDYVSVSYLTQTPDGEKGELSMIGNTLKTHLGIEEQPSCRDDGEDIETTEEAFERMALGFRAATPLSRALYELLWQDESMRGRLSKMKLLADELPVTFEDENAAKRFFGDRMILSASKVNQFQRCRFAYFCDYGVKARPLRAAEIGALEFGTLAHYVMENTLPVYIENDIRTIPKERCFTDANIAVDRYVEQEMGGLEDKPAPFLYQLTRLRRVCGNFLWQAVRELSQSRFVPTDYELDIALSSDDPQAVKPMVFTLPDGSSVTMVGKIDRVDICDIGGVRYARVIDYKTGSTTFRLSDIAEGINLQMLIYMMTLWKNGHTRYGEILPAGLLYMPSKMPLISVDGTPSERDLEKKQTKAMRMNGLLLNDEQVLRAMEPDVKGVFIPASMKKDGSMSAASSLADLEQFGILGRHAQRILTDMAQTLREGDIDAMPFAQKGSQNLPCTYCPYQAVCGHEDGDHVREPKFADCPDLYASLQEEEST